MQDKLRLLLEQINLPEAYFDYFKDGSLDKIIGNKNKNSSAFNMSLMVILKTEVYFKFIELLNMKNIK